MSALFGSILRIFIKSAGKKALPKIDGTISVEGLSAPVEIIRDKWGIPHIYAAEDNDVLFAQGFVHAQDRLWQMELHRRMACGRLSELIGKEALDTDRATRTFGFYQLARKASASIDEDTKHLLESYTRGVNEFLRSCKNLPPEFGLLKHKPEPWALEDSIAFGQLMGWQFCGEWKMEITRSKVLNAIGKEKLDELEPEYPAANPAVVPKGIDVNTLLESSKLKATKGPHVKRGGASNLWAIAGTRTSSGKPIHCSDPHIAPMLPSIWYACHLSGNEINVTGVSPPGVPLVLIGHNSRVAWGITVSMADVEDVFIEKMNPDNPHQYLYQDKWLDAEIIEEKIKISKQETPFVENVMKTIHGPVISDVVGISGQAMTVCSKSLQPTTAMKALYTLARGKSWADFVDAMKYMNTIEMNMTYADVDGNIGSYVAGDIPIRKNGDGSMPVPGWTGEYDWIGDIPFDEKPHCFNPEKGFVVTANNCAVNDENYQYFISKLWDPGYRAKRITETIDGKEKFTMEDCKHLHVDVHSIHGEEFVKWLEGLDSDDPDVMLALKLLREWDCNLTTESIGGAVYDLSRYFTMRVMIEAGLEKEMASELLGKGFNPVLVACTELFHSDPMFLFKLLGNPGSWWIKQAGGKDTLLKNGMKKAIAWLRANVSKDPARWHWGKVNKIVYPHAFAMKKPLDKVFNVGPFPMGGNKFTVLQASNVNDEPWGQKLFIPSYRHVIDFSDLSKAEFVYAPGQSGNLASRHYRDLFELWYTGKYIPMLWTREQVEQNAEGKLMLTR
ncbi:MAG TPA: penicillin acylase family protein [Candidatus Lokiarchaeia archaeon]|nr:penicillin acylase family protein [Candidatus Lokiarchaeia archaeon]